MKNKQKRKNSTPQAVHVRRNIPRTQQGQVLRRLRRTFTAVTMLIVTLLLTVIFGVMYYASANGYAQRDLEMLRTAADAVYDAGTLNNEQNQLPTPAERGTNPDAVGEIRPETNAGVGLATAPESEPEQGTDAAPVPEPKPDQVVGAAGESAPKTDQEVSAIPAPPQQQEIPQPAPQRAVSLAPVLVLESRADGGITILANRLYSIESDTDTLTALVQAAKAEGKEHGILRAQALRYLKKEMQGTSDGAVRYAFSDITAENQALRAQLAASALTGAAAFAAFFGCTALLSGWITKPVEEAWNRQQQFVSDASHELKTPLTVILSNARLMLSGGEAETEHRRAGLICDEAVRMKQLVESLLELARSDAGKSVLSLAPVNLSDLAKQRTAVFETVAFEQGRTVRLDISADAEGKRVTGDERQLSQLFDILLDNACKYSRKGSVIETVLNFRKKPAGGKRWLCFQVISRGTPLTPQQCRDIFLRFYRTDQSRGEVSGYGLGLSLAERIVSEHGGSIAASSDGKDRNVFTVLLPAEG